MRLKLVYRFKVVQALGNIREGFFFVVVVDIYHFLDQYNNFS